MGVENRKLNILIAGEGKTLPLLIKSKFLNKLYITSEEDISGAVSVRFNAFQELAQKCRALKVDMVIAENEKWILQGIADVLRRNLVNCFALNTQGDKLILSNKFARELLHKYNILTPKKLAYPVKFPVVVRADGFCETGNSLDEIIEIRERITRQSEELAKSIFLEEFILLSLYCAFDNAALVIKTTAIIITATAVIKIPPTINIFEVLDFIKYPPIFL